MCWFKSVYVLFASLFVYMYMSVCVCMHEWFPSLLSYFFVPVFESRKKRKEKKKARESGANVYYRASWCACAISRTHACRIAHICTFPPSRCQPDGLPGMFLHQRRVHHLQHEGAQLYFTRITVSAPLLSWHSWRLDTSFFLGYLSICIRFLSFLSLLYFIWADSGQGEGSDVVKNRRTHQATSTQQHIHDLPQWT